MKLYRFKRRESVVYQQIFQVEAESLEEAEDKLNEQTDNADNTWITNHCYCENNEIEERDILEECVDVFTEDSEEVKPLQGN